MKTAFAILAAGILALGYMVSDVVLGAKESFVGTVVSKTLTPSRVWRGSFVVRDDAGRLYEIVANEALFDAISPSTVVTVEYRSGRWSGRQYERSIAGTVSQDPK